MQARGRAGRRSSCSFERSLLHRHALSFVHAWRKGLGSLLSYPLLVATLCFNPAEGPQIVDGQQISWVPTCRATICSGAGSTHTWRAPERRLHFDSPTRTRVNSDSSVNDGYCFRLFSVDTSPSTYFPPFFPLSQVELCLAVRERWLTAANFDRRSHCLGTMPNFYFREAGQPWTLYRHPMPCDFF